MENVAVKKIRLDNQNKVLNAVLDSGGITRNALAKHIGVSLMTITNVVDDLIDMGLLSEQKCETRVGRTPTRLHFSRSESVILGLDLTSKTGADYLLFNLQKTIVFQARFEFSAADYTDNLNNLCARAKAAAAENGFTISGIGVSVAGVYNPITDTVMSSLIAEQCNVKLRKLLSSALLVENIVIEHDVNAAALAEIKQAPDHSSLYFLYVGDGVGGSYLESGHLNLGHDLLAGEVGQTLVGIPIYPDILENVVSKYAIESVVRAKNLPYNLDEIIMRYRAGDDRFSEHINYVLSVLNVAVYNLIWQYNPTYIVVKSPSRPYQDLIVERASAFFADKQRRSEVNIVKRITTRIVPSFIENNSALDGLFYLVKESLVNSLLQNANSALKSH